MILDYKNRGPIENGFLGGKVLVDGVEIRQVWYIDTALGIVKTYDVFGDGKAHASRDALSLGGQSGIELPVDGVATKTLNGKIELFFQNGAKYSE